MIGWATVAAAGVGFGEVAVVDLASDTVFVASPAGGIDAIAVGSGERRWHTDEADLPLASSPAELVAWDAGDPRVVRIVRIDPVTGGVTSRCADRAVPEGRALTLHEPLGGRSWITPRLEPGGVELWWGGWFHPVTGTEQLPIAQAPYDPSWRDQGRCVPSGEWASAGPPPTSASLVPAPVLQVVADPSTSTWRARAPGRDVRLAPFDPAGGAYGTASADGGAAAVVRQVPTTEGVAYDARTGKVLGPFPQLGPTWVRVGEGYLFATDHALVAATATGEVRWTVPALSRAYDGPVPP